jgi:glycosyltransferase involved in cell wall biosynthesis
VLAAKSPFISVIVTAFNRKEFLFQALSSAINQTLDRSKYEIIVVKNFEDQKIDDLIEKFGIISLQRGNEIVGSYLAAGIERSSGEVLVFLDDDDEFVEEKLRTIQEIFATDPRIGYYHNGIVPIDSSGKEIPIELRRRTTNFVQRMGRFYVQKPLTSDQANKLLKAAAYGYLSTIAVRKSVVLPFISYLKSSIESVQDLFMFYCGLLSAKGEILVVDPLKLTRYRIHEANVSLFLGSSRKLGNGSDTRICKFLSREEKSMEAIMEMSSKTLDANQNKMKSVKMARKMIGYELYNRKLNLDMVDPLSSRRRTLSDSIKFFKYSFRSRFLGSQIAILIRSILFVFAPKRARREFVKRFASQGS